MGKAVDYRDLIDSAVALVDGIPHGIANMANISALIYGALDDLNWAGFYITEGETLVLGPFQGKPACIEIPYGRGVCGTAAKADKTIVVPDVEKFPGHIACDGASRSEIVVPFHKEGKVAGVLDIDSFIPDRFSPMDEKSLTELVKAIEHLL